MTEGQGRHAADGGHDGTPGAPGDGSPFARPAGAEAGYAPRPASPAYSPPPPTVSPDERAAYARPAQGAAFAPAPGERIAPRRAAPVPVPYALASTFRAPPEARDGFDPEPGTRMPPRGAPAASPWWKPDALRDPWRDPTAPFWLGRGAVFTGGRPAQVDPAEDVATDPDELLDTGQDDEDDDGDDKSGGSGRRVVFGLPRLGVLLVLTLVAGLIGGGVGWLLTRTSADSLHRPDITIPKVEAQGDRPPTSTAGIAKRVGPAVVSIAVKTSSEFAIGSGVVIDTDGDVLTNNHVVSAAVGDKSASIVVTFSNEAAAKAKIVGRDPTSDLAVIKVPNTQLTVARLGDSAKLAVGDPVIAIGSPLGLQGTVTAGIVSALNRPVHVYADDGSSDAYLDAIQTDAPINPGNSGGALVSAAGTVIGINSAAAVGSSGPNGTEPATSGIGYAIPINYARAIALQLIHTGKAKHGTLGAQGRTVLSGVHVGAYLVQVSPGGPAAKAGLHVGDVIVAAQGKVVQTFDQLVVIVQERQPGDRISVTYYPSGGARTKTATVTLG